MAMVAMTIITDTFAHGFRVSKALLTSFILAANAGVGEVGKLLWFIAEAHIGLSY
jgi:hypothetical protein